MASRRIGMFGVEPSETIDDRNEDGVAALLRRRREELERDVDTVARQLRIRAIYIRAIEEGRLQDLPGTAYAVGFVRAYADYLGLDGNSIVSDYRDELARRSRQNQLIWPVDQVEHKHFPGVAVAVVSIVTAMALYGGWYFVSQPGGTGIDLIDRVPDFMKKDTAEESSAPVEGAATAAPPTTTAETAVPAALPATVEPTQPSTVQPSTAQAAALIADTPASGPAETTSPVAIAGSAPTEPAPVAPPVAGVDATSVQPATPAATNPAATAAATVGTTVPVPLLATDPATSAATVPPVGQTQLAAADAAIDANAADAAPPANRIMLRATKDSWVEIFDADKKVVLQRILRAGETYAVPDQPGLVMNTGNAGGLVIELDGREQPSLGSIGVVKRDIRLEPVALTGQ